MKKLKLILLVSVMLLALLTLMSCNEECTHANLAITSASNGQHTVACDACDYEITEKCSGGKATCQKGAICDKCDAEYTAADENAHTLVNGACTVEGCTATCDHAGKLSTTSVGNGQHKTACSACDYALTENCSGGTATCKTGPICTKCNTEYGVADANAHAWANGACTVEGCGVTCDHAGKLSTTSIGNEQHKIECSVCDYALTEGCTGGAATCKKGPICTECHTEYGAADPDAHDWNATTGECDTEGCIVICQHIGQTTVTNVSKGQHKITCSVCGHEKTQSCTGGTATCKTGPICENCHTEYGTPDANAHTWDATTGICSVTGCNTPCSHSYTVSDNNVDDNLHTKTCSICQYTITESCSGGSATCEARATCEKCGAAHGELLPVDTKYKYVVVIGLDGAGTFFRNTDTPNIDKIFANGAVSYNMLTSNPSISAQSWGALMHGVTPTFHGLTNSITGSTPYDPNSEFPSFFRVIRENDPNAVLASFSHWSNINIGIIEDGLGVYKSGGVADEELTNQILAYLDTTSPNAMFVQFDEADGAGHVNGYNTPTQLAVITRIDGYIGQIYDKYVEKGIIDETLFIVTADHGGSGKSHGGWTDAEKYIMFAAAGRTVKKGGTIQNAEIRDTAAIVLHALGHEDAQPETWTAYVPGDLFVGVDATDRPVYKDPDSVRYHENEPTPSTDSGKHVTDFVDNNLSVYLPFDGNANDQCGNTTTTTNGNLYFIQDGYYGSAVQLDDGYVTLNDYILKDQSFTASMWLQVNGAGGDPVIFSNADWSSGKNPGFTLSLNAIDSPIFRMNVGHNGSRHRFDAGVPANYREGWMHVTLSVDRENNQVIYYVDFGTPTVITYDMTGMSFEGILNGLNIGQDGTGAYPTSLSTTMDEFMIFEGVFTLEDNSSLAMYYGKDLNGSDFPVGMQPTDTPEQGGKGYISNFVDKDLYAYLPFDGTTADTTGNKQTTETKTNADANTAITYEDAVFGKGAVLDNGYVSIQDYAPGTDSFTVSFFIKADSAAGDPAIISNKNWNRGYFKGYILYMKANYIGFNVGDNTDTAKRIDASYQLPYDFQEVWTHVVLVVDRTTNEIKISYNFDEFFVCAIPENLQSCPYTSEYNVLNIGQDGTGTYGAKLKASMDELMIFNGAFDSDDLAALANYYNYVNTPSLDDAENTELTSDEVAVAAGAVVRLGKSAYYTTLQKAIDSANAGNGRTITLLADATVSAQTFSKALNFDLNGKALTLPDPADWTVAHTITNGNVVVNGTTYTLAKGTYAVIGSDDITFTAGAKLGNSYYAKLQDAIDAALAGEGGTITMLADAHYGTTGGVFFTKNVTIDGQGKYKITATITTSFYQVASNVTLTLQDLVLTTTKAPSISESNVSAVYLPNVGSPIVNINNCTITSTNDIAVQSWKNKYGTININHSTIFGHTYGIRFNNSDHTINISNNSNIHGGTYGILMEGTDPCANIIITDSTVTPGIYLNKGKAKVTLAGNTIVNSTLIATLYPNAGYAGSEHAVQIVTANNGLTIKDNAKIVGSVNHAAGSINFTASTQIIRQNGTLYSFYDTVDAAFATALQDGEIVFTYNQTVADAAKTQGYTVSEENGYYKIVASNS